MSAINPNLVSQRAIAELEKCGREWQEPESGTTFITISIDTNGYERHAISLRKIDSTIMVIDDDQTLFTIKVGDPAVDEKALNYLDNLLEAFSANKAI